MSDLIQKLVHDIFHPFKYIVVTNLITPWTVDNVIFFKTFFLPEKAYKYSYA